ncbi:MAG: hypothetical protein BWY52_02637 [Chloroflexi bacterium ADurb.Bin325]|nr:MAG: hypothetical protein BWY52_02637 [Chloroflexi bacterium ADurb.Bin325]
MLAQDRPDPRGILRGLAQVLPRPVEDGRVDRRQAGARISQQVGVGADVVGVLLRRAEDGPVAEHRVAAQVVVIGFERDRHRVPVQADRVVEAGTVVGIEARELGGQAVVREADADARGVVGRVAALLAAHEARRILQEQVPIRAGRVARAERGRIGRADLVDVIAPFAGGVHAGVLHDVVEGRFVLPIQRILGGLALAVCARAHRDEVQPVFRVAVQGRAGGRIPIARAQRVDERLVRVLVRIAPVLRDEMAHAQLHVIDPEGGRVGAVGHDPEGHLDILLGAEGGDIEGVALPVVGGMPGVAQIVDVELRAAQLIVGGIP